MFIAGLIVLAGPENVVGLRAQDAIKIYDNARNLSASDILDRVRLAYASISSYRDTGWTVHQYQEDAWTNTFSELFGPRNCYRVEVITAPHPFSRTNRFWCDGLEHCNQMGEPTIFHDMDLAGNLISVAAETSIPAVYFLLQWGNPFTSFKLGPDAELLRKSDEIVGEESCYVVARTTPAHPATLWISRRDFLIRRCKANGRTETHENISTNEQFHTADYLPLSVNQKIQKLTK